MLGTVLKDVFADINIYDDDIRLLQQRFVSPIGNNAISFYKEKASGLLAVLIL